MQNNFLSQHLLMSFPLTVKAWLVSLFIWRSSEHFIEFYSTVIIEVKWNSHRLYITFKLKQIHKKVKRKRKF